MEWPLMVGWDIIWLVVWNMNFMTSLIVGMMIQSDFHIFQRGRYTTNHNQWEFQDPKMEVRQRTLFLTIFCGDIPGNLGLKNRPYIW